MGFFDGLMSAFSGGAPGVGSQVLGASGLPASFGTGGSEAMGGGGGFDLSKLRAALMPLATMGQTPGGVMPGQSNGQPPAQSGLPQNATPAPGPTNMPVGGTPVAPVGGAALQQPSQMSQMAAALQQMSKLDPATIKSIFSRLNIQGRDPSTLANEGMAGKLNNFTSPVQ